MADRYTSEELGIILACRKKEEGMYTLKNVMNEEAIVGDELPEIVPSVTERIYHRLKLDIGHPPVKKYTTRL